MDIFYNFCNICCNTDTTNLKNIFEGDKEHFKETLITLIGHEDIVNKNAIYLCKMCCEELTRFHKFREICFINLVEMRQIYFNMKTKLELQEDAVTVANTLKELLHGEVLQRYNSLGKNNNTHLNSTELQKQVKDSAYLNKNRTDSNRQPERNRVEFVSNCSDISLINNNNHFTYELHKQNEMQINNCENMNLEKVKSEPGEDFNYEMSHVNNSKERNTSQIEFVNVEPFRKIELDNSIPEDFEIEDVNFVEPLVCISGSSDDNSRIECTREELHVNQECRTSNMENCLVSDGQIQDNVKVGMKLLSAVCNSHSSVEAVKTQEVLENYHRKNPTTVQPTPTQQIHSRPKLHTCTVCNKCFVSSSALTIHERIHTGAKPYECTVCNKTFRRLFHLNRHERIHTNIKPYQCNFCYKAFTDSSNLTRHKRIQHTGDRPYICMVCNKAFTQISNLVIHESVHSGERPFNCTVCNKDFNTSSNLITHERIHNGAKHKRTHSGIRPYKCTICNKAFMDSSTLTKHERVHRGDKS